MKRNVLSLCYLFVAFLCSSTLYSQEYFTQLRSKLDDTYSELNLSLVKTGFLQDYGIEYVELDKYQNGVEPEKYLSAPSYLLLLESYYDCAVDEKSKRDLPDPKRYSEIFLERRYDNYCPVGILLRKYNYIAPRAKSLFSMNANRHLISQGDPEQLYSERTVVAMAPQTFLFKENRIPLVFPRELAVMDSADPIVSISLQLSSDPDRIYETSLGGQIVLEPSTRGEIKCDVKFMLRSGLYYTTSTLFYIAPETVTKKKTLRDLRTLRSDMKVPIYATRHHGGGTLEVELQAGRTQMKKPILIVEGFDVGSFFPNYGMDGRSFFRQGHNYLLLSKLRRLEYDICYLNYNIGTADIYRNAELAKDAIRYINAHKDTELESSQLVVLGHSMGGLVACAALRGMEISQEKHDVWKYISYDSPHYGASVPPSAIYAVNQALYGKGFRPLFNAVESISSFFSFFGGTKIDVMSPISGLLHSTAAQQMLQLNTRTIENATSKIIYLDESEYYKNKAYARFMERYHQEGLPQKTINVAFSNGSLSGETTYQDKSQTMPIFRMGGYFWLGATLFDLIHNDQTLGSVLTKFLIGHSTIDVSIEGNPILPKTDLVYRGEMFYTKHFLFLFPFERTISKIEARNFYRKYEGMTPDFVAGGTLDMPFQRSYSANVVVGSGWYHFSQTDFTLVPRNSALGIPSSSREASEGETTLASLQDASPFDVVYAPQDSSLNHMNLGGQITSLGKELAEPAPPRAYTPQINGPSVVTPPYDAVYTISNPNLNPNPRLQTYSVWLYMSEGGKARSMRVSNYNFLPLASDSLVLNSWSLTPGKYEVKLFSFNKTTNQLEDVVSYLLRVGKPDISSVLIEQDKAVPFTPGVVSRDVLYLPTLKLSYSGYGDITDIEFRRYEDVIRYPLVDYRYAYNPTEIIVGDIFPQRSVALLSSRSFSNLWIGNNSATLMDQQTDIIKGDKHTGRDYIHRDPPKKVINVPTWLETEFSDIDWVQTFTSLPIMSRITGDEIKLKLQVRIQNQAGWSEWSSPFEYYYTGRNERSALLIAPNVVTSFGRDAILKRAEDNATTPLPYGNIYRVSIISHSTGKLCRDAVVEIDSPIGLVDLPKDVYIVKVYNHMGKECGTFSAIKQ